METQSFKLASVIHTDNSTELLIGFSKGLKEENSQLLKDALRLLKTEALLGGHLIKLNGECSLPVAMALAHAVADIFQVVACFDPKLNSYVVCISRDPAIPVGQIIPNKKTDELSKKIVLCGPPHSGKSCLRYGLKTILQQIPGAPYPYVITACPDGEGAWFHETASQHPALAVQLKTDHKQAFSQDFAERIARNVKTCSVPLVLVDVGGKIDDKNRLICAGATHAIILAANSADADKWLEFCQQLNLQVVAQLESDYHATADRLDGIQHNVLRGAVHHLERGEDLANRPIIQELARHLLSLPPVKNNAKFKE
jgi:CRISPR-associated protein Csx3